MVKNGLKKASIIGTQPAVLIAKALQYYFKETGTMSNRSKRVLIVEDEEDIRDIFTTALTRNNHIVEVAENGRLGFRKATTFNYDIILFDLHMPEWNGVDSIKGILMVKPKTKFIVISAYADRKIADDLRNTPGVLAVLLKPADVHTILSNVESV